MYLYTSTIIPFIYVGTAQTERVRFFQVFIKQWYFKAIFFLQAKTASVHCFCFALRFHSDLEDGQVASGSSFAALQVDVNGEYTYYAKINR